MPPTQLQAKRRPILLKAEKVLYNIYCNKSLGNYCIITMPNCAKHIAKVYDHTKLLVLLPLYKFNDALIVYQWCVRILQK